MKDKIRVHVIVKCISAFINDQNIKDVYKEKLNQVGIETRWNAKRRQNDNLLI